MLWGLFLLEIKRKHKLYSFWNYKEEKLFLTRRVTAQAFGKEINILYIHVCEHLYLYFGGGRRNHLVHIHSNPSQREESSRSLAKPLFNSKLFWTMGSLEKHDPASSLSGNEIPFHIISGHTRAAGASGNVTGDPGHHQVRPLQMHPPPPRVRDKDKQPVSGQWGQEMHPVSPHGRASLFLEGDNMEGSPLNDTNSVFRKTQLFTDKWNTGTQTSQLVHLLDLLNIPLTLILEKNI